MKIIKKTLSILLIIFCIPVMTFCSLNSISAFDENGSSNEQSVESDLEESYYRFEPSSGRIGVDEISIALTHSESILNKDYTAQDFSSDYFIDIRETTGAFADRESENFSRTFVLSLKEKGDDNIQAAIDFLLNDERIKNAVVHSGIELENSITGSIQYRPISI